MINFEPFKATDAFTMQNFNEKLGGAINQVNSEISEISGKVPEFVMGTYDGDDTANRTIELGFTPKALIVADETGVPFKYLSGVAKWCGGVVLKDYPAKYLGNIILSITDNGFIVNFYTSGGIYIVTNRAGRTYHYIALK